MITLEQIAKKLNLTDLTKKNSNTNINSVYTSDLLSDILANAPEKSLIITVQAHINTVAVAWTKKSPAIIICNNISIPEEIKTACIEYDIELFSTPLCQYETSGLIYQMLN